MARIELLPEHCGYFRNNQNGPIVVKRKVTNIISGQGTITYLSKTIHVQATGSAGIEWRTYRREDWR